MENKKVFSDEELMLRIKRGEFDCFEELVMRHQQKVINTAFRITGNHQEAEEIAQEVFLKVYQAAPRYRVESKFSTYLYRITVNLSLNQLRQVRAIFRRFFSEEEVLGDELKKAKVIDELSENPFTTLERKEVKKAVRKAIQLLPRRSRVALVLSQYQGLSYQSISEILKCSPKAVERLIYRGKIQLKKQLNAFLKKGEI